MQAKMKMHQLPQEDVDAFLAQAEVGRLGSTGADGFPYIVPLHFAYVDGHIYFHGLNAGEKMENIARDNRVSFEADAMDSLRQGEAPCNTGTRYTSVIVKGTAEQVTDNDEKIRALNGIVDKYTPRHSGKPFGDASLNGTAVVRITVREKTGKKRV